MKNRKRNRELSVVVFQRARKEIRPSPYSWSCRAVERHGMKEGVFYSAVFQLRGRLFSGNCDPDNPEIQEEFTCRIVALTLAEELVRDGFTIEDFPGGDDHARR